MSYTDYIWFLHNCIQCFIFSVFAKHTLYSLSSQIQNGIDWGIVPNEISECISLATYCAVLNHHLLSIESYPLPNVHLINMFSQKSTSTKKKHKNLLFVSTIAFPLIFGGSWRLNSAELPDMMRPTRRICRRPPELQAANARAFSKGTPSSRRAFARDTWRKLKNSDSARNVTLQNEGRRMKQIDTLIWMFNPNLKKEHTFL